jgi:hypothetical protein
MTDLEDKILKKNVPGRFSTFWKDENDSENENESAASDYAHHKMFQSDIKISSQSNRVHINRSVNTGIKGILTDYRNHQEDIKLRNEKLRAGKIEEYHRTARGPELKYGEQSISISSTINTNDKGNHTDISDSDSDIELDEGVLSSYRSKRFQHLHQVQSFPSFGHITELQDANEFSEVIDDTDSRVCCIFHLYDNSIARSKLMNEHIIQLARNLNHCRFFRIEVSALFDFPFDPCGLPSLLVYKNGVEVANLTPVTERIENAVEYGYRFTVEDVEKVLRDVGVCD